MYVDKKLNPDKMNDTFDFWAITVSAGIVCEPDNLKRKKKEMKESVYLSRQET